MKVDGSIRNLLQGVSQQPARVRVAGQCSVQENFRSNPVDGLQRRPPMEHLFDLFTSAEEPQWHNFKVLGTSYIAAFTTGGLRVFDLAGDEYTVVNVDSAFEDYLTGGKLTCTTIEGITYVANTTITTAMDTDEVPDYVSTNSLVFLLGGQYGRTYDIKLSYKGTGTGGSGCTLNVTASAGTKHQVLTVAVNAGGSGYILGEELYLDVPSVRDAVIRVTGVTAGAVTAVTLDYAGDYTVGTPAGTGVATTSNIVDGVTTITGTFTAPDGSSAAHTAQITTTNIATQLENDLNSLDQFVSGEFQVTRKDDVLYIESETSFSVAVADGDGGSNMYAVNNFVRTLATLPRYAPHGYVARVQSSTTADVNDLYVMFRANPINDDDGDVTFPEIGEGFGQEGTWVETSAPDLEFKYQLETMPHILAFDADEGYFEFGAGDWTRRQVGDEESNENPGFIGHSINHMSSFQGRLVLLASINAIMSRTNVPEDFFLRSATTLLDDDPIDIQSTAENVEQLSKAVPFNRDLVIFAGQAQFICFGRNSLTPKNASLVLTTAYEAELNATPVPAGKNVFYAINYGAFTGIREFFTEGSEDINDSRPTTQHVLKYMRGTIEFMASSPNFNTLIVHTDDSDTKLYVYEYLWEENVKKQSSWSTWIMPNPVSFYFFDESRVYLCTSIGNNYNLELIDLDTQEDTDVSYQVHLDRKVSVTGVNTEIVEPWVDMPDIDDVVIVQGTDCPNPGMRVEVDSYDVPSSTITLKTDMEGGTVWLGVKYMSRYRPTMPHIKDADGVKVGTGKLVISKFFVNYDNSGPVWGTIVSPYADDQTTYFSGRIVDNPATEIGVPAIQSGVFAVPFREEIDNAELELWSDAETPLTLLDIEWLGQWTKKGKRIARGDR